MVTHGRRRRRYGAVECEAGEPRGCHGDGRQTALCVFAVVSIADGMHDGDVSFKGDRKDVDVRRHQQTPQRHRVEPEATDDVSPHSVQVCIGGDVRLRNDQERREHVDETLIEHEHVDVLTAHRPEIQDDNDDEHVANTADRSNEVVSDGDESF